MERKGLLSILLSLVFAVGGIATAAAKPHHRHHAKAKSAEKGGSKGSGDSGSSHGKSPDSAPGNSGHGDDVPGNGNANASDQGNGNSGKSDDAPGKSDEAPGNSDEAPGNSDGGPGKSDDAPGKSDEGPGKSEEAPGRGAAQDGTVVSEVPAGLLGARDIDLGALPVPQTSGEVLVAPQSGEIFVQNGDGGFLPMEGPGQVPVGAFVDARAGVVTLVDKLPDGSTQAASFSGSKFQVKQTDHGVTALILRGSSFRDICGKVTEAATDGSPGSRVPGASAARAKSKKVVRSLWASDHKGKYQTYGRNSVATVRGTVWQTVDRCDGTLIRVAEGEVVVHDRRTHKDVVVSAGHSFLARDPGA